MNRLTAKLIPIVLMVTCLILIAGCSQQAAISDTPAATIVPTAGEPTAVSATIPTLPAATQAPAQPPAATALADRPSPAPAEPTPATSDRSDSTAKAIEAAILAQYPGSTPRIQCIQGDFAAAIVLPPPGGLHGTGAYLHKQDGAWTIAAAGLDIFREDLLKLWRSRSSRSR